jgi:hypothetical protein
MGLIFAWTQFRLVVELAQKLTLSYLEKRILGPTLVMIAFNTSIQRVL